MKGKRIALSLATASLLLSPFAKADNVLELKNVESDNLDLTIEQVGANNTIQCYNDNSCWIKDGITIDLKQMNTSTNENIIEIWHLEDGGNTVRWGQGVSLVNKTSTTWVWDNDESGGHYSRLDIHGSNNTLVGYQQNGGGSNSGHIFTSLIFSDDNDIWIRQKNNGQKELNLYTTSDGNTIDVLQKSNGGEHTANITLTGSYPTDISLIQRGQWDQSYSITNNCITVGGCTISVQQGN